MCHYLKEAALNDQNKNNMEMCFQRTENTRRSVKFSILLFSLKNKYT